MSVSSLVAGSVTLSKTLWEAVGRKSVFGDDADELVQARSRLTTLHTMPLTRP